MQIDTGEMTSEDEKKVFDKRNKQTFFSGFNFLNDHKGLQVGEVSTLLGPKGGSKSTFIRTIISEILWGGKPVFISLSEEATLIYKAPIHSAFVRVAKYKEKANMHMSKLFLSSQLKMNPQDKNINYFIWRLEQLIVEYGFKVFIIDNFTTSFLGRGGINDQAIAIEELKRIAVKWDIAILVVLHTSKKTNVYENILDGDDVRGNATSINMGSYNYIVTTFFRLEKPRTFLTVDKARYHALANKKVYELFYDKRIELFSSDKRSSFDELQGIINALKKKGRSLEVTL